MPYIRTTHSYHQYLSICLCIFTLWLPACVRAIPEPIIINIIDDAPYHAHPPGKPFKIALEIKKSSANIVSYYWRDFRGAALTKPVNLLLNQTNIIQSPSSKIGYYELVIQPENPEYILPNRKPGEERSYGFAILPKSILAERLIGHESQFGVVHANIKDPYLPTWIKTMTWNSTGVRWWNREMIERREMGKLELPIIAGADWDSDDSLPILPSQLERLHARVKSYFNASPSTVYWETGIEENLKRRYDDRYYWENLEQKLKMVRKAATHVNPDIKLIYQIAGLKQKAVENFAKSRASKYINILSIHPYAWPDFPTPETWHDKHLQQVRQLLDENNASMPIWYTEIGVTHHGSAIGDFFGYPEKNAKVTGLTRYQAASYLIKVHVMALHADVKKLFWYNYQDREAERGHAENNFGLRDFWGHPKPVYPAYVHLHKLLAHKTANGMKKLPGNIRVYQFTDKQTKALVLWQYPATATGKHILLSTLLPELQPHQRVEIANPVGATLPFSGNSILITGEPVFIVTNHQ